MKPGQGSDTCCKHLSYMAGFFNTEIKFFHVRIPVRGVPSGGVGGVHCNLPTLGPAARSCQLLEIPPSSVATLRPTPGTSKYPAFLFGYVLKDRFRFPW